MVLQLLPGSAELLLMALVLLFNLLLLVAFLGGLSYFVLRIRSGGRVDERLDRIERKVGRLEAQVEHLQDDE
jgi:hypothetical protein